MEENRRLYSLNLVAYLYSKGYQASVIGRDEVTSKAFFIFSQDLTDVIKQYKLNRELQLFLHSFNILRAEIRDIK